MGNNTITPELDMMVFNSLLGPRTSLDDIEDLEGNVVPRRSRHYDEFTPMPPTQHIDRAATQRTSLSDIEDVGDDSEGDVVRRRARHDNDFSPISPRHRVRETMPLIEESP